MNRIALILLSALLVSTGLTNAPSDDANAKIKVIYIYNFTKYIEWPQNYKEGHFVISILGNSPGLLSELDNMRNAKKKAGNQDFEFKSISSIDAESKCHILFIPSGSDVKIADITAKLKGKSTLIITEKPGSIKQGAMINFIVQDSKQKFELNKANAEKYNLKISSALSALAVSPE